MFTTIMSGFLPVASTNYTNQIQGGSFDKILLLIRQDATNPLIAADLPLIRVIVDLLNGKGERKNLINARLIDLLKLTDLQGGYAYDPSDTDTTDLQALISVGSIDLGAGESLVCTLQFGAVGTVGANCLFSVIGVDSDSAYTPLLSYESIDTSGTPSIENLLQLFLVEVDADRTIIVSLPNGYSHTVNDTVANALTNAEARIESEKDISLLWADKDGEGKSVTLTIAASLELLAVKRIA